MSLKDDLFELTKNSKNDKSELAKKELVILGDLLLETMKADANRGHYVTKLKVNHVKFPNIMYMYLETKELFNPGSGMLALRKDLESTIDSSLFFKTETDGTMINILTYWG